MQYILTQDELDATAQKSALELAKVAIGSLRVLVVGGNCIHTPYSPWTYCDQCPLSSIGEGSKVTDHELSRVMCDLRRRYSK